MDDLEQKLLGLLRENQFEAFINKRVTLIRQNKYPVQLSSETNCRYIMHIVPDNYEKINLDIRQLDQPAIYFSPYDAKEGLNIVPDFNFDGVVFTTSLHQKLGYSQVFRNGIVEIAIAPGGYSPQKGNTLSLFVIQHKTISRLERYINLLKQSKFESFSVYIRLIDVLETKLNADDIARSGYETKGGSKSITREEFIFPTLKIDQPDIDFNIALKPLFDIFWNIFGFREMPAQVSNSNT